MAKSIHTELMPLYIIGGLGAIAGVFYLVNKNVDNLTKKLSENKTLEVISDPAKAVEKAVYSAGTDFWDLWDSNVTEPFLRLRENLTPDDDTENGAAILEAQRRETENKYPFVNEWETSELLGIPKNRVADPFFP